ncbi:MAG: type II secretion system F family protein [Armatimonadota bacterium]
MAKFSYMAIDPASGKTMRGIIEGDNQVNVLAKLHEQKLHVVGIDEQRKSASFGNISIGPKRVKLMDLVIFSRQFATMINAGVSIVKCLDILESQTKSEVLKSVIAQAMRDVKGGSSLTDAFAKNTTVFSKLYINMLRAAELGGILDEILDRIAGFLENDMDIRTKIKSAMMYPIIVLIFSQLMLVALFTFVLPKFKDIFSAMDVEMPIYTKVLFDMSDLMKAYWYIPLSLIIAAIAFVKYWGNTPQGRYQIDYFKLKIPIVGDIIQKLAIGRFARTFGTLVSSGVPMMRALEIVGETAGNSVIAKAVEKARDSVREGQKISAPLEATGFFPSMVTHMIDVGEETGRLSDMLVKVSEFYEREVDAAVKGLTSLIEPMLIVVMGVIVGFIAVCVMGPIFKLVSSIN